MYEHQKYKKLVFYLEACESGSMFNEILPKNWNIYATTASNPFVGSFACDYDQLYETYLNDCFSRNWMNDTEYSNVWNRTLKQQFDFVKYITHENDICKYGDFNWENDFLGDFMASKFKKLKKNKKIEKNNKIEKNLKNSINSRFVDVDYWEKLINKEKDDLKRNDYKIQLQNLKKENNRADFIWSIFANELKLNINANNYDDHCYSRKIFNLDCLKNSIISAEKIIGYFNDWSLYYTDYLNKACEKNSFFLILFIFFLIF
jgi:hypothetical protein